MKRLRARYRSLGYLVLAAYRRPGLSVALELKWADLWVGLCVRRYEDGVGDRQCAIWLCLPIHSTIRTRENPHEWPWEVAS